MFQKNTFAPSTSFGGFNSSGSTSSPFGFKPAGTASAFGAAPAFGATATPQQPVPGSLFGATTNTGGLFGASATPAPAPAFGTTNATGFGFGQTANTSGSMFGSPNISGGVFGQSQAGTSAFGAKPAGFGFGASATPSTSTNLFGAAAPTTGLFGQQSTLGATTGGTLFGATTTGFGQQQQQNAGTSIAKFNPMIGTDTMINKNGSNVPVNIKYQCITCMKEYEGKSLEELRLEDYLANRRGNPGAGMFGGAGSAFQPPQENKPATGLFGQTSAFGQPATTSAGSMFGTSTLGSTFGQNNSFSFGGAAQTNTSSSLFGAAKPAFGATSTTGGGLFGTPAQPTPAFGAAANTGFGLGAAPQQQTGGFFGAKPATGFGAAAPASSGFGAFGASSGGLFGAKTTAAPTFGTTAPAFGGLSTGTGFGASTSTTGGIFGSSNLGAKPTFGAVQPQPTLGGGLGALGGASAFNAPKPTFPSFSSGSTFGLSAQTSQPLTGFGTNTSSFGTGLGGFGTLGGSALGASTLGAPALGASTLGAPGAPAANTSNVHEQILSLASRPYGDSPLFKDLPVSTGMSAEDILKPTNPAAVKAVLDKCNYRVSGPDSERLRVQPLPCTTKKSLFDGLEESDASLEERLSMRPSRKRLVLRPNQQQNNANRSTLEESGAVDTSITSPAQSASVEAARRRVSFEEDAQRGVNTDLEQDTEKRSSWMGSSLSGSPKSRPSLDASNATSPRMYPDLEKEISLTPDRRSSWLTSKPLAKPSIVPPPSAESSIRELGARPARDDKENIEKVSEEERAPATDAPPHPAGVKLTKPGYYTIPSLPEMTGYIRPDGSCIVPSLTIGRINYGSIHYSTEIDVANLDIDKLVHFMNKEVCVYESEADKPPVGQQLNRAAVVTLERVWPRDKTQRKLITDPDKLLKMDYEAKLRRVCDKHNTKFVEYRPETGSWVFKVEHFSKYGLTDSDDEDDTQVPEVIKRQLQPNPMAVKPPEPVTQTLLQRAPLGLQMLPSMSPGLGAPISMPSSSMGLNCEVSSMSFTSALGQQDDALAHLNGSSKGLAMDTSEENSMESTSLYPDAGMLLGGIKSPTAELARLEHRGSRRVQLMKASLYSDSIPRDMDDDVSVSTTDQMVPQPPSPAGTIAQQVNEDSPMEEECIIPPLHIKPDTIILKHHKSIPPFHLTIAGELGASCLADMSVSKARYSRVGFSANSLALVTTRARATGVPLEAPLNRLEEFLSGRSESDWSGQGVTRLAVAGGEAALTPADFVEWLEPQLRSLLSHSERVEGGRVARVRVRAEQRLQLLQEFIANAEKRKRHVRFGASAEYAHSVWTLCMALHGARLCGACAVGERDDLRRWLPTAVTRARGTDLPEGEPHEVRILDLMTSGQLAEACRVAREHRDYNLAAMIAQSSGDTVIRQLLSRQLESWAGSGALGLVSAARLKCIMLAAGERRLESGGRRVDACDAGGWLRRLVVHHYYLCPQVCTIEQLVTAFEASFLPDGAPADQTDIATLTDTRVETSLPLPEYDPRYHVATEKAGKRRQVLDLRYELMRARARDTRPDLQPATYTPDPLDYSLGVLVAAWMYEPSAAALDGLCRQLVAAGAWHLAVLVAMYHANDTVREASVKELVLRNIRSRHDAELELLRRLDVPESWVLLGCAQWTHYKGEWKQQAELLVEAEEWNAAYQVLMEKLFPDAVLNDNVDELSHIVERLAEAAERGLVADWRDCVYHYVVLHREVRTLSSGTGGDARAHLEALSSRAVLALRSLPRARSARGRAACGEAARRLLRVAGARAAALIGALPIPHDYARGALAEITTEFAEQAAESCAVAAASPHLRPVSNTVEMIDSP